MNLAQNPTEKRKVLFYTLGCLLCINSLQIQKYYDFYGIQSVKIIIFLDLPL